MAVQGHFEGRIFRFVKQEAQFYLKVCGKVGKHTLLTQV